MGQEKSGNFRERVEGGGGGGGMCFSAVIFFLRGSILTHLVNGGEGVSKLNTMALKNAYVYVYKRFRFKNHNYVVVVLGALVTLQ